MLELLKKSFAFAIVCFAAGGLCPAQTPPIFNVKTYGAAGDGATIDTPAINAAIIAANAAGGGTVTFPPGNYLSVSIHLTNDVTLYLSNSAVILAAVNGFDEAEPNPWSSYQDYGHSHFHDALIWGENLSNIGFAGPGTINGNANLLSGDPPAGSTQADKAISLKLCTNVTIAGITITRAGHFGILANGCQNFTMTNTTILNATLSNHRDAINLINSSHCCIARCQIEGSDDAMCLKADYALGQKFTNTDIQIENCNIRSTQNNATQFGSETVGDFSNVRFANLNLIEAGKAGIGITSNDGSIIDGLTYDNITMTNCACTIHIKLSDQNRPSSDPHPVGRIRNVSINNVTARHSVSSSIVRTNTATIAGFSSGSVTIPIENIVLSNVNISTIGGNPSANSDIIPPETQDWQPNGMGVRPSYGWYVRHATNISFFNCQTHFDNTDGRPALIADDVQGIKLDGFVADVNATGPNASPYDLGFTNVTALVITNATGTNGLPLRIFSSNATSNSGVVPLTFTFEAESIPFITNGAPAILQNDANNSGGHWLAFEATGSGQFIQYTVTNIPAGTYDIQMSWKGNSQRGISSFAVDGTVLGGNLDQYSPTQIYPTTDYGIVTFPNGGNHDILLTCVGKNPAANGYWISTDRFIFIQLQAGPPQSPHIDRVSASGANLIFNGSNGIPTATYYVLSSTNVSLPLANWTMIATNVFDAGGSFNFTNAGNAVAPKQFYLLKYQLLELP